MMRRNTTEENNEGAVDSNINSTDTPTVGEDDGDAVDATLEEVIRFDAEVEVQNMINFFDEIDTSEFDCEKQEALAIITDRIKNDNGPNASTPTPAGLFENLMSKIRGEIVELLLEFVPQSERRRTGGSAYLKKWFQADNLKRHFLYRSKESLVTIAATCFGKRLGTSLTYDKLIEKLIEAADEALDDAATDNSDDVEEIENFGEEGSIGMTNQQQQQQQVEAPPIIDDVIKAVLKKSFMKHLKGGARGHCQMGHKLKLPIGKDFMRDLNERNKLGGIKIISLHKVGLVGKQKCPWAKDSIDFLACVLEKDQSIQLWGVEVKSRQTISTITKEKEHTRKLRRKNMKKLKRGK